VCVFACVCACGYVERNNKKGEKRKRQKIYVDFFCAQISCMAQKRPERLLSQAFFCPQVAVARIVVAVVIVAVETV
jgi:hypothetical protein